MLYHQLMQSNQEPRHLARRKAEERAAAVSEQLQGATTHHAEQRAASRNQQAQLHAQTAEREREVSARAASLEGEA